MDDSRKEEQELAARSWRFIKIIKKAKNEPSLESLLSQTEMVYTLLKDEKDG